MLNPDNSPASVEVRHYMATHLMATLLAKYPSDDSTNWPAVLPEVARTAVLAADNLINELNNPQV